MMAVAGKYTTRFQAGLGLIQETRLLLGLYEEGMTAAELGRKALKSGLFPTVTARRLRNVVSECFAPRYLAEGGAPARYLKVLLSRLDARELAQLLLLFTARSQAIFADFIRTVYWSKYEEGQRSISNEDASRFVRRALDDGLMEKRWTDTTVRRVSAYLTGCAADYGLLEPGHKTTRRILGSRVLPSIVNYLAYDLHFRSLSDNALVAHADWGLFGLDRDAVLDEIKRASRDGHFIVQSAGEAIRIAWKYASMGEACHGIAGR